MQHAAAAATATHTVRAQDRSRNNANAKARAGKAPTGAPLLSEEVRRGGNGMESNRMERTSFCRRVALRRSAQSRARAQTYHLNGGAENNGRKDQEGRPEIKPWRSTPDSLSRIRVNLRIHIGPCCNRCLLFVITVVRLVSHLSRSSVQHSKCTRADMLS